MTEKAIIYESYICECGGKCDKLFKSHHIKTNRHQKFINNLEASKYHTNCVCGGKFNILNKSAHFRTLIHINYMRKTYICAKDEVDFFFDPNTEESREYKKRINVVKT